MLSSRIPLYLTLCALGLLVWAALFPGASPDPVVSWTIAGIVALSVVFVIASRSGSQQPVTFTLDEAARLNAARNAAPRSPSSGETR